MAALVAGALVAASAVGQDAAPAAGGVRIAVVDLNRVRREYKKAQDRAKEIDKTKQELVRYLSDKKKELESMEIQLSELPAGSRERRDKMREYRRVTVDAKVKKELDEIDLRLADFTALREVIGDIYAYVEELAKRKGLLLVLFKDDFQLDEEDEDNPDLFIRKINSRKIVYVADELDITTEVYEGLNKKYRLGSFKKSDQKSGKKGR